MNRHPDPRVPSLAFLLLLVVLTAAGRAVPSAQRMPQVVPIVSAGNVAIGRALYGKIGCESCHGPDGQGTAAGPRLAATSLRLSPFTAYVRMPTGTMPVHSAGVISDRGLADIYAFLRAQRPSPPLRQAAASASMGRADAGATLYRRIGCYQCHVNEAQGGANGPRIGPDPIPFARFSQYVRNPSGDMPPYTEQVLSAQEMADIYAFVQTRPRPPALNTIPQLAP